MSTELKPDRPPPIVRPNGKLYRPRAVVAHAWNDDDSSECGAVVTGTHDVERARALAERALEWWLRPMHAIKPEVGWFRSGFDGNGQAWVRDEVRGAAGVMFTASDDPEGE